MTAMAEAGMALRLALAFGGGVLAFLSPCCLPLYPSYLSYLTGLSAADLTRAGARGRVLQHGVAFVLGLSVIWLSLGLATSLLAQAFLGLREVFRWTGGLILLGMGAVLVGVLRVPWLLRERRVALVQRPAGYVGSFLVGLGFAAGWTPCVGPILSGILALALAHPGEGVLLLLAFTLGFGIPFVALAYALGSARWIGRYSLALERLGGGLMMLMGFLLLTRQTEAMVRWVIDRFPGLVRVLG